VTGQRSYADEAPGRLDPTYDWDNNDVRIDRQALEAATNAAFQPGAHTAAFVVVHKGEVIAERYGAGADRNTALVGWSMGKSITTTLLGVLMEQGEELALNSPAPVPKWQAEADPRKDIRLVDLLHMSSGLRFSTLTDPESTWHRAHPDHMLVYSGAMNVFDFSEAAPPEFPPNSVGRYRNCDPLIVGSIIRRTVEARGQNYLLFPYTDLFQPVGIRGLLLEPDLYGNFVMTGFDYGRGRDWARLGQLYLQDGVWNKTRILPKGWAALVATPAPAWDEPEYGAFFWLNDAADWALPKDSFYMAGGGGQYTIIVPSLDLVVVRMGHYKGGVTLEAGSPSPANKALNEALALIVMAVANDRSDNKEDRT
jgi:CubicO group peptidase (beta-lactamase class C family)